MDVEQLLKKHGIGKGKVDVEKVLDLLNQGQQITAIKLVLHQSGAGLRRSKDLCDDLQKEIR
jgi:hypothetical protein